MYRISPFRTNFIYRQTGPAGYGSTWGLSPSGDAPDDRIGNVVFSLQESECIASTRLVYGCMPLDRLAIDHGGCSLFDTRLVFKDDGRISLGTMTSIEVLATILGILCVGLLIVRSHWSWPIGLVQVILQGVVLWNAKLYAETALQGIFWILQLYGWWAWIASNRDKNSLQPINAPVQVERLSTNASIFFICATLLQTILIAWFLMSYTDGKSPIADAFITAASLTAQYLLAKRYYENWGYWIVVDILSIPLYVIRELPVLAILYVVFLAMAIVGFYQWRTTLRNQAIQQGIIA